MPYKVAKPCKYPGCVRTTAAAAGYCQAHAHFYQPPSYAAHDNRPSAAARGYNNSWQRIREEVLRNAGIPRAQWPLYDVHHAPDYNPSADPDHRHYTLTPMLHGDHSRHTGSARSKGEGV